MNTKHYYSPKQGRLPVYISDILNICDPVLAFDRIMEEIEIDKYLKPEPFSRLGRPGYNRVNMLKTILFGFMDTGYASLRELEDRCKTNIRYMYLMDYEKPSYRSFSYFINEELTNSVQDIFKAIMTYIEKTDGVDLQHLYIDGSKFEANANKYSWVWKKATEKSRYRLYAKITALFSEMNDTLAYTGMKIETNTEYTPEVLETVLDRYAYVCHIDEKDFVSGSGHRKSMEQRFYEKLKGYLDKLREYVVKIKICGPDRNSYSKTDPSATFMRIKTDYMGNDQLLPAYNIQIGVADEYIAVVDVMQYRSDIDCFIPLMEKFHEMYGFYRFCISNMPSNYFGITLHNTLYVQVYEQYTNWFGTLKWREYGSSYQCNYSNYNFSLSQSVSLAAGTYGFQIYRPLDDYYYNNDLDIIAYVKISGNVKFQ